jgi:hypothetical protein
VGHLARLLLNSLAHGDDDRVMDLVTNTSGSLIGYQELQIPGAWKSESIWHEFELVLAHCTEQTDTPPSTTDWRKLGPSYISDLEYI